MTWTPGKPVSLETQNYLLRSLTEKDATDRYLAWWNDAELQNTFNHRPRGWGHEELLRHIRSFNNRDRFNFGIFPKPDKPIIGFISAFVDPKQRVGLTNFMLGDRSYWGKDVIVEAKRRVIDFLFEEVGIEKAEGKTIGRNPASFYINRVLGFKNEGILRKQDVGLGGKRQDVYLCGLLREEWLRQRNS